ncbi:MAG TPA: hypothetical protein VF701_04180 [Thermoanaerobaculia bacterium]
MARQPRVEYAGALHHGMSRGNGGIPIFRDDEDRLLFLELLAQEIVRSCWVLHEYCLMTTHVHLEIETPECTRATGMHRLLARYAQRFNKRHGRRGRSEVPSRATTGVIGARPKRPGVREPR